VSTIFWLQLLRVIHIYAAIMLVGSIVFNTAIVVSQKIGAGLMIVGTTAIVLLGISGFGRLWVMGQLPMIFSRDFVTGPYGRWIMLMAFSWFLLLITGSLSGYWYQAVLTKKLPYSAGLRDLEEKRAAQERVTLWQDRFYYLNVVAAVLATLGGAMAKF
jgi:hypothetical protein